MPWGSWQRMTTSAWPSSAGPSRVIRSAAARAAALSKVAWERTAPTTW